MEHKRFCTILSTLIFMIPAYAGTSTISGSADVNLYLYPPSTASFSNVSIGGDFTVEVTARADAPGVTLLAFTVIWTPADSVEFVRPTSENSQELILTDFFPPTAPDLSRLSGIAPDWTSQEAKGSPGATPEIAVFTAPAANYTGPGSLAKITFKKLSEAIAGRPTFSLTNVTAARFIGGTEAIWVSPSEVTTQTVQINVNIGSAQLSGAMLPQATMVVVTIGGRDYQARVTGNTWTLDIKAVAPSLAVQPVTVRTMQGNNLLSSVTSMEFIRSAGWFRAPDDHSGHPGDSDGDGSKNSLIDLVILARSYDSSVGNERYDFRADYNADGVVNLTDLLIFTYYGK